MRYILIFIILSLTVNAACADYAENFTTVEIPNGIPYSNERVNVYVAGETYGSLVIENRIITSMQCEELNDPTYNVYFESEDLFTTSYGSVDDIMQLVTDGVVVVEPQSFVSNVKYTLSKWALKMVSWFW